jgi:teichuronic acid exporter
LSGFAWSFLGSLLHYGINFLIGIILARLLGPAEFGLIGMTTVFITISEVFINSGFSQALVRKQNCVDHDYQTVFVFNLIAALTSFLLLFLCSELIADYFREPKLIWILRMLGFSLVIGSFSLVQKAKLLQDLNFKRLNILNILSNIVSGILAIVCAYLGFGVWSLVVKIISREIISSLTITIISNWRPKFIFELRSFRELFQFGSKLLLSGFINTIFNNFQYLIIGKLFSAKELGFYARAEQFKNLPSQNFESIITSVGYPLLAKVQHDRVKLTEHFSLLLRSTVFVIFLSMFALAACSESIILILLGDAWRESIGYLQLLCAVGMMYPILSININLVNVMGRSDIYLHKQLLVQLISLPLIVSLSFFGINTMIVGIIISTFIAFGIFASASAIFVNYTLLRQIRDIFPIFSLMALIWGCVYFLSSWLNMGNWTSILFQLSIGCILIVIVSELTKQKEYMHLKTLLIYYTKNRIF